jgi:hypothetical protein
MIGTLWSIRQATQLNNGAADPFLILLAAWIVLILLFPRIRFRLR